MVRTGGGIAALSIGNKAAFAGASANEAPSIVLAIASAASEGTDEEAVEGSGGGAVGWERGGAMGVWGIDPCAAGLEGTLRGGGNAGGGGGGMSRDVARGGASPALELFAAPLVEALQQDCDGCDDDGKPSRSETHLAAVVPCPL